MLYSVRTFGGMLPRVEPRLLNDKNAQVAQNVKLRSGAAVPFFSPSVQEYIDDPVLTYSTLKIHDFYGDNLFLRFEDDVDIVRGPVANDQHNRSYITGLDVPRVFDNTFLTANTTTIDSSNSLVLAIPVGTSASMSTDGLGTGDDVTRAYVYTYIREWADGKTDEGQPSDPATVSGQTYIDCKIGDTITITDIEDCPDQAENGVSRIAVYRAVTGTGNTQFQLCIDFDIAEAKAGSVSNVSWASGVFTFTDDLNDEDLGEVLPSITWLAPVDDLQGIISLNNGIFAAFADNVVYFSETYQPHAWPAEYQVTIDFDIVGLGAIGNNVVVLTDESPLILNAQDPSVIIPAPTQSAAPCVSKHGIVSFESSVYFPSVNGLFIISTDEIKNITQELYTYDSWLTLMPSTFNAVIQNGRYIARYSVNSTNTEGLFIIDLTEALAGASVADIAAVSLAVDPESDTLYYLQNHPTLKWIVAKWEGLTNSYKTLTWKSKIFLSQQGPMNVAAARVRAQFLTEGELEELNAQLAALAAIQQSNLQGALDEVPLNEVTFNGDVYESLYPEYAYIPSLTFKFYQDGELKCTKSVLSDRPFRLPAGISGTRFECEIISNVPVFELVIATSMRELM